MERKVESIRVSIIASVDQLLALTLETPTLRWDIGGYKIMCSLGPGLVQEAIGRALDGHAGLVEGRLLPGMGGRFRIADSRVSYIDPEPPADQAD